MKNVIFIIYLLWGYASAQDKPITTAEAEAFFQNSDGVMMQVVYEGEPLFDMYAKREPGEILILEKEIFKVVGVENAEVQNCAVLSIQTNGLTGAGQEKLKKEVIAAYKSGIPFVTLLKKYCKDEHSGAPDIDIMLKGTDFEEALATHKAGDVFTIDYDVPKGFYLIAINTPPRNTRVVKVLTATYR